MTYFKPLLLALLLATQPALATDSDIAQRAQRVRTLSDQWPRPADLAYAADMQREYVANFGQIDDVSHLRAESDADLQLHWQAIGNTAFYSSDQGIADAAVRIHGEMERRGQADAKSANSLFNFLLKARRFDEARAFAARNPDAKLPAVPQFVDADTGGLPSVWRFKAGNETAERIGIDLQHLQVIVAAGCHFSEDAARDIAGDPVLGPVFATHARWLTAEPGSEKLEALADWNRNHPQTQILPMYDRSEWALIEQWVMPTFVVVKDGKVVDSVDGWDTTDPESREQLIALLQRTGLLEAGTR